MTKLIAIYDESVLEIFGQLKLPKVISQNNLIKLESISKKI